MSTVEFMRVARSAKARPALWHAYTGVLGSDHQRSLCGRQAGIGEGRFFNVHLSGQPPRYNDGSYCAGCLAKLDALVEAVRHQGACLEAQDARAEARR